MSRSTCCRCRSRGMCMRTELTHKTCSRCKEIKPLSMFSPEKKGSLGRKSRCKRCNTECVTKRRAEKKMEAAKIEAAKLTYPRIPDHMKQCRYCLKIKVKEGNFRRHAECEGGVVAKCHSCFNRDRPSRAGDEYAKKLWKKYYTDNREKLLKKQKYDKARKIREAERYIRDKDRISKVSKAYTQSARGKAVRNQNARVRAAMMKKAQPEWLSPEQVEEMRVFYWLAQDLKAVSGEVYHVDHIVPLRGGNVCGLHVPVEPTNPSG